jgi:tetratricopeptide (TPR) repeat protein
MSGRAAAWLLLAALVCGAGFWAWAGRTPAVDARLEQVRAGARQAEALQAEGRPDEAADRYLEAADLAEAAGELHLARGLRAQAAVPLKLAGRVDEARAILLPVLEQARAAGDHHCRSLWRSPHDLATDRPGPGFRALVDIGCDCRVRILVRTLPLGQEILGRHAADCAGDRIGESQDYSDRRTGLRCGLELPGTDCDPTAAV